MDFEITKREILFSAIILFVMLCVGFFLSTSIINKIDEDNERYYQALKIDNDPKMFSYGMKTSVGDAFVTGSFQSVGKVSFLELAEGFWFVERTTERYTRHTRVVTTTDGKGHTRSHTETYYTWDTTASQYNTIKNFIFLGETFSADILKLTNSKILELNENNVAPQYQSWIRGCYLYENAQFWSNVGDIRYSYSIIPQQFNGTMYVKLSGNTMFNAKNEKALIPIYYDKNIEQAIAEEENSGTTAIVCFWILWILLTAGAIYGFYRIDNRWIED